MNAPTPNPEFSALARHKNPLMRPAVFTVSGNVDSVLTNWRRAIASELHENVRVSPSMLAFGPTSGACTRDGGATTRYGYTHHALTQLFTRTNHDAPVGALVKTFEWVGNKHRASLWAEEIMARGDLKRTVVLRLARDSHATPDVAGARYVRAVVSEAHALELGDDKYLDNALTESLRMEHMRDFANGHAYIVRDPSDLTYLHIDSRQALPNNARIRLVVSNSEVGKASARVSLAVAFSFEMQGESKTVDIELRGANTAFRAIHKSNAVSALFDGLGGEFLPLQTAKALAAIPALNRLDSERSLASYFIDLPEKLVKAQGAEKALAEQGVARFGSRLSLALALSFVGERTAASEVYESFERE